MSTRKEDRRSRRTREQLQQAAMALMQEKRYSDITVQDIIDRANVGRSTFYLHYQDKDDLVNRTLESILDGFSHHLANSSSEHQPLIPTLALFEHIYENQPVFEAMAQGHGLDIMLEKGHVYWSKRAENHLQALLNGQEQSHVPISLVAHYLSGTLVIFLKWWMQGGLSYTPQQMDELFQQMVMPGLKAAMGDSLSLS